MTPPTSIIRLADGRRLAFAEWGDPHGLPIVHQHGMPGSRLEHQAEPSVYEAARVRVITPDRPGYGLSDPQPGRGLLDWASDVRQLADALGLGRLGITSLSGGGIYALACAATMPERLTAVITTGCPAPMREPGALRGMRVVNRAAIRLGMRMPWALDAGARLLAHLVRRYPRFFVEQVNFDTQAVDRRWLSLPAVRDALAATLREAVRAGAWGYLEDVRVLFGPWAIDLTASGLPVQLWHGELDTVIPLQHGRHLASVLPGATLRICPGEAHLLMWNHLPEILAAATGRPPTAGRTPTAA